MTPKKAVFTVMPLMCGILIGCLMVWAQGPGRGPVSGQRPFISYSEQNIARADEGGKILHVSSEFDKKDWSAAKLIDGKVSKTDDGFAWASESWDAKKPEDLVLGFAGNKTRLIGMINIDPTIPYPAALGRTVKNIQVFGSDTDKPDLDGIKSGNTRNWKYVARLEVSDRYERQQFEFSPVEAKYLWLHIIENQGSDKYVAMGEVEVYEALSQQDEMEALITRMEQLTRDMRRYREAQRAKANPAKADVKNEASPPGRN